MRKYEGRLENYRRSFAQWISTEADGYKGLFLIPFKDRSGSPCLKVLSSGPAEPDSGLELKQWEHVSVSCNKRSPTWEEMCFIKSIFWEPNEWVIQYHPVKKDYVNNHPHCLHLWKYCGDKEMPTPPTIAVGIK